MLEKLSAKDTSNFVFSPYGIRNCFAFVYPGANGKTKAEMESAFLFDVSPAEELQHFKTSNALFNSSMGSKVEIANSLWIKNNFPLKAPYTELINKYTNAVLPITDAKQINQWVSNYTSGNIKDLVSDAEIKGLELMLLNAISLDAKWQTPFPVSKTYQDDFFVNGEKKSVPMMTSEVRGRYYENNSGKIFQLFYTDDLCMTISMPTNNTHPPEWNTDIQRRLTGEIFLNIDSMIWTNPGQFILHLPKFKVASTYNLIPPLSQMGLEKTLSYGQSDFSKMGENLYIKLVKQKAMIEVTEYGTKAAAATVVGIAERGDPPAEYKIDRPFYFIIHHIKTGEILFMGRIMDPSTTN